MQTPLLNKCRSGKARGHCRGCKENAGGALDVLAVTKDGHEIPLTGREIGGTVGAGVRVENFDFDAPLSNVAKFIIGTRPIRTMVWKNVVLPP